MRDIVRPIVEPTKESVDSLVAFAVASSCHSERSAFAVSLKLSF